jgi:hypothetical protein
MASGHHLPSDSVLYRKQDQSILSLVRDDPLGEGRRSRGPAKRRECVAYHPNPRMLVVEPHAPEVSKRALEEVDGLGDLTQGPVAEAEVAELVGLSFETP